MQTFIMHTKLFCILELVEIKQRPRAPNFTRHMCCLDVGFLGLACVYEMKLHKAAPQLTECFALYIRLVCRVNSLVLPFCSLFSKSAGVPWHDYFVSVL